MHQHTSAYLPGWPGLCDVHPDPDAELHIAACMPELGAAGNNV
jgi:hypothetical protein